MKIEDGHSLSPSHMERTFTVLTCHFGDSTWLTKCLENIDIFSDSRVVEVIVVNQNRKPEEWIKKLPRVRKVIEFPLNGEQVSILGHDHPSSLDLAISTLSITTSHLVILDSDCFPVARDWLDFREEIVLASDPTKYPLSHPCFMMIPQVKLKEINFSDGISGLGFDTGRLVALQLEKNGTTPAMLIPRRGFNGTRGDFYAEAKIFHFGSGSFRFSSDSRLQKQVMQFVENIFIRRVLKDRYTVNFPLFITILVAKWITGASRDLFRYFKKSF